MNNWSNKIKKMKITEFECPINVVLSFHVDVFHTFKDLSVEQVIRIDPSCENKQ